MCRVSLGDWGRGVDLCSLLGVAGVVGQGGLGWYGHLGREGVEGWVSTCGVGVAEAGCGGRGDLV